MPSGFLLRAAIILFSSALWWLAGRNYAKYSPEGANPIKILGVSGGKLLRVRHHLKVYLTSQACHAELCTRPQPAGED